MAFLALGLACVCAWSQAKFAITGYKVQGNTLLALPRLQAATQPFTGPQSDFETIQQAVEALEKTYSDAGYGSVKIEVPEQELAGGMVTLLVVEGKLGQVSAEPNPHFDANNLRRSLPALREGETTHTGELDRNLQLANESGSKHTTVTFKRNPVNGLTDAIIKVTADDPQRWLALLDNSGSAATGYHRLGLVYQHNNLFNRDHALSVQAMTSPGHWSQVGILGLSYRLPMYDWGGAWDFNASYSSVDSGKVAQAAGGPDFAISGGGRTVGARYTHNLYFGGSGAGAAAGGWSHKASLGLERRNFANSVTLVGAGGASLVPDLATTPLSLGYSGSYREAERDLSASFTLVQNLPGAPNGSTADFNLPGGRAGATEQFQVSKYNLAYTERWAAQGSSGWSLRLALSGQASRDLLISPEQFGAGGADSVRGFAEREVSGDQGLRWGAELGFPSTEIGSWRLLPSAFIDAAQVRRNQPAAGEVPEQNIGSAGLGLRATYGRHAMLRLDWGSVTRGVTGITGSAVGNHRLHASFIWIFH